METKSTDDKLMQTIRMTRDSWNEKLKRPPPENWKQSLDKAVELVDVHPNIVNQSISVFAPHQWFDTPEEELFKEKLQKSPADAREVFSCIMARQLSTCFFLSEANKKRLFNQDCNKIDSPSVDTLIRLDKHMMALMDGAMKLQMPANFNINNNTGTVNVEHVQQINQNETDLKMPAASPHGEHVGTES